MVEQLQTFATELNRISLEIGTKGLLGGQILVSGAEGTRKVLTVRSIACGDLSKKITVDVKGEILDLKNTLSIFSTEVTRVALEVETEEKLG
ncbi:hypothetical protein Glove_433g19 [Diversispora epigaea]|uniref:Uncharacterized protein n=1 Tax=Diversispora epigaea TaxID=1348612 RepID=A0A397GSA0_9GLOM|nr:hypothetical protein Glove_433g19 [Diversispora epigaea]